MEQFIIKGKASTICDDNDNASDGDGDGSSGSEASNTRKISPEATTKPNTKTNTNTKTKYKIKSKGKSKSTSEAKSTQEFIIDGVIKENIQNYNSFILSKRKQWRVPEKDLKVYIIEHKLLPHSCKFSRLLYFFGTHAFIYSIKYRLYALENKDYIYKSEDWDEYMNFKLHNYSYYKPLITQIFLETENQRNWPKRCGLTNIGIWILHKLGMDKHPQPGFNIGYIFGHTFSISIIILIIWLLFTFSKYIYNLF